MITLRTEKESDFEQVYHLIEKAFEHDEYSDHREQDLVERLRKSPAFVPELSIVAESDDRIIGHILLTKIKIHDSNETHESLALAPVAVLPEMQGQGVGTSLINKAHEVARELGFTSVILLGHKDYYPRFGYKLCQEFGIQLPFDVPAEYCMALELVPNALSEVSGTVEYDSAFNE